MKTIIRGRGSGKAKELLQFARENNAIVVTADKRAFQVKADSYGFNDIKIIEYNDLLENNFDISKPVVIHNGDKMLQWLIDKFFCLDVIGMTATAEE